MSQMKKSYDVIVVGAGPNGLACSIAAQKAGLSCLTLDKGGLCDAIRRFPVQMNWFSTAELLEIGDVPLTAANFHPTRTETLHYYRRVAEAYDLELGLHCEVTALAGEHGAFVLDTAEHGQLQAKHVVWATGYYDDPNKIGVQGESLPHVSHYYDEPYAYFGSKVVVVGGQNSAADTALELFRHGVDVTLIHRGEGLGKSIKYWIRPDIENRIKFGEITGYFNTEISQIEKGQLHIVDNKTAEHHCIAADHVFILTGYRPNPRLLIEAGVEVDEETLIPTHDEKSFETNVKGLYIAGSVVSGKFTNKIFVENGKLHGADIIVHIKKSMSVEKITGAL